MRMLHLGKSKPRVELGVAAERRVCEQGSDNHRGKMESQIYLGCSIVKENILA